MPLSPARNVCAWGISGGRSAREGTTVAWPSARRTVVTTSASFKVRWVTTTPPLLADPVDDRGDRRISADGQHLVDQHVRRRERLTVEVEPPAVCHVGAGDQSTIGHQHRRPRQELNPFFI